MNWLDYSSLLFFIKINYVYDQRLVIQDHTNQYRAATNA